MVTTGYDRANRQSGVTGMLAGSQTNYATGASYAAHGGAAGFAMANNITQSFDYNNRLQMSLGTAAFQSTFLFAQQLNWGTSNNNGGLLGETVLEPGTANPQATRSYT